MSIQWEDNAVSDALRKYHDNCGSMSLDDAMRSALDAAVKAQGIEAQMRSDALEYLAVSGQAMENYARGRVEAFEEAAKKAESFVGEWHSDLADGCARNVAAAIRNLAKEGK
jgi:hypothetical protein